jgi:hypothetical protein
MKSQFRPGCTSYVGTIKKRTSAGEVGGVDSHRWGAPAQHRVEKFTQKPPATLSLRRRGRICGFEYRSSVAKTLKIGQVDASTTIVATNATGTCTTSSRFG